MSVCHPLRAALVGASSVHTYEKKKKKQLGSLTYVSVRENTYYMGTLQ